MTLGDVVHELAHVYDGTTGLAPGKAWGAVQLYFARTYPDCFQDYGAETRSGDPRRHSGTCRRPDRLARLLRG